MTTARIALKQVADPALVATARELFLEYAEMIGTDLEYQGFSTELDALPGPYKPPHGALLVALVDEEVAGCVAMRPLDDHTGEMKRLYVRPAYRSFGLGQQLVDSVIRASRAAGYRELRLDTLASMAAAQALYQRLGFAEIPPYNEKHMPGTRFYSLQLAT